MAGADGAPLCPNIRLDPRVGPRISAVWPAVETWALFDAIDDILNGVIFPVDERDRGLVDADLLDLIRRVLRSDRIDEAGRHQYSFMDLDYSTVRTETISALYKSFFDLEENGARRKHGAFYTPPYLVDYVLDEIDQIKPLNGTSRVVDPACGSGAFLVVAFRRIVEEEGRGLALGARRLRVLLRRCIGGIELHG